MRSLPLSESGDGLPARGRKRVWRLLRGVLLLLSLGLYALHFVHLTADFPHDSPWNDWSKYTDEGWYGDGAIRHFVLGHWFLKGDFNPAVAMPVWPLAEALVFRFGGVSLGAARALAVGVFGVTLLALYGLLRRHAVFVGGERRRQLAAPLAILLACASPFLFAFDRLAILEPPLAALAVLTLWVASYVQPLGLAVPAREGGPDGRSGWIWLPAGGMGVLLALMVLTKPTAVALLPAMGFYLAHRAGFRWRQFLRMAVLPFGLGAALWGGYLLLLVRPQYTADYRYLFDANAYTGFQLEPLSVVVLHTVVDGQFIGLPLYVLFFALLLLAGLFRPRFFRNALVPTLLLWAAGTLLLLGYHNNLQPRYYLLFAVPVTALVALGLEEVLRWAGSGARQRWPRVLAALGVTACAAGIAVPDAIQEIGYVLHPDFSYLAAARRIAAIIRADPSRSQVIVSISGSDLTLMTGLPSIDDDFGIWDLEDRVRLYRPGWYVAWNQLDDDKMDALQGLYKPVRVAAFPAMDDPDRNLLILYRLDPARAGGARRVRKRGTPRPLRTRSGQQPATEQLRH